MSEQSTNRVCALGGWVAVAMRRTKPMLVGALVACLLGAAGAATARAQSAPTEMPITAPVVNLVEQTHDSLDGAAIMRSAMIRATVVDAGGAPVAGAVVVTSAGGRGVSDSTGAVTFAIDIDNGEKTIQVTAAATHAGASAVGSKSINVTTSGEVDAGTITIEQGADCQPAWLPLLNDDQQINSSIFALVVFDDGAGPALYAAGSFGSGNIAKWDGQEWSSLGAMFGSGGGLNGPINALAVFDDGSGPALYAGGYFFLAPGNQQGTGVNVRSIAKWDGESWSALGEGLNFSSSNVRSLAVFDDGSGPALYVGGYFTTAGDNPIHNLARWDGKTWSEVGDAVGQGLGGIIFVGAFAVFDDGSGPALYVGLQIGNAGDTDFSRHIARWDGESWTPVGGGVRGGSIWALTVFDDGSGPALYAGGDFTLTGIAPLIEVNHIARWDGESWTGLGNGMDGQRVWALAVFDDGSGPALYASGKFTAAGDVDANNIARWDGESWSTLDRGINNTVAALAVFDNGTGPALFAGGTFTRAGGLSKKSIAQWSDQSWAHHRIHSPFINFVTSLAVFDDGSGPALYVGGFFNTAGNVHALHIARWDGESWAPLAEGTDGRVLSMAVFDDGSGPALYAGGTFIRAGEFIAFNIARWDGEAWSPVGGGLSGIQYPSVEALTVFDDGKGPALYAGGNFDLVYDANFTTVNNIARWDGESWSALANGLSNSGTSFTVLDLEVFDDGSGLALYTGGRFSAAGDVDANSIARWDGQSWSPLGAGLQFPNLGGFMPGVARTIEVFDDGSGPALYVGGNFTHAGNVQAYNMARWDGEAWLSVGNTLSFYSFDASTLVVFDDGAGKALYAGGGFQTTGDSPFVNFNKWDGESWSPVQGEFSASSDLVPFSMTVFDDGSGPALFIGGLFSESPAGDASLTKYRGCAASNPVDLNGDGVVNGADLASLLIAWGEAGPGTAADFNNDGVVNGVDLAVLLTNWG